MAKTAVFSALWRFDNVAVIADPGAGQWRWNSTVAPTQLAISALAAICGLDASRVDVTIDDLEDES